jgi:hypothetical protein
MSEQEKAWTLCEFEILPPLPARRTATVNGSVVASADGKLVYVLIPRAEPPADA